MLIAEAQVTIKGPQPDALDIQDALLQGNWSSLQRTIQNALNEGLPPRTVTVTVHVQVPILPDRARE